MPIVKECVYYGVLSSKRSSEEHIHLIKRGDEQLAIPEQLPKNASQCPGHCPG